VDTRYCAYRIEAFYGFQPIAWGSEQHYSETARTSGDGTWAGPKVKRGR